jgi:transposase
MTVKCMAGIDLHSNNLFCAIVDLEGKRVFEKKLPCDLDSVLRALKPFKKRLEKIAVESTYNWYWLVDGLQDHGYPVVLANPAAMEQYNGLKHADDKSDGFFLAEMARLNILPTGNICDRKVRPVRDLLRRRMGLVQKRTSLILSLKSLHTRMTGRDLGTGRIKTLAPQDAEKLFEHPADQLITRLDLQLVEQLGRSIQQIETAILAEVKSRPHYQVLQTMPGVGKILGLTIALETTPATAGAWTVGGCPTAKRRGKTTPNAATNIWPGRLWRRRSLPGAMMIGAGSSTIARARRSTRLWRPRRWPASWPRRPGT